METYHSDLLRGKCALVSGATRGIGKAVAVSLAEHAATVAFHGRSANSQLADRYNGLALGADLSHAGAAKALVQSAVRRLGRLDIVVICVGECLGVVGQRSAGDGVSGVGARTGREVWLAAAAEEAREAHRSGATYVVIIGDTAGMEGTESGDLDVRAELQTFTRRIAMELAPVTRVNCIISGPDVQTGGLPHTPDSRGVSTPQASRGQAAREQEVAGMVLLLVSGSADLVTGQTVFLTREYAMR